MYRVSIDVQTKEEAERLADVLLDEVTFLSHESDVLVIPLEGGSDEATDVK